MRKLYQIIISIFVASLSFATQTTQLTVSEVMATLEKSADYHMRNIAVSTRTNVNWDYSEMPTRVWHISPYYDGMLALARVSGNPVYWKEVLRHGTSVGWTPNPNAKAFYHADDHAVGDTGPVRRLSAGEYSGRRDAAGYRFRFADHAGRGDSDEKTAE